MTQLQDVLTSADDALPDVRVIGASGGRWVVEEVDEFSAGPRELSDDEAAAYGVANAPQRADEQQGWRELAKAPHSPRRAILAARKPTPEELLASGEADAVTYQ